MIESKPSTRAGSRPAVPDQEGTEVRAAVTIMKPANVLYAFWRKPENLTKILKHPFRITALSESESHWETRIGGHDVKWNAVIFEAKADQLIAWRTEEPSEVLSAGTIRFEPAPGDYGTEVRVQLKYKAPGGKLTSLLAKLTGKEPSQETAETLRRFKTLMEAGELPTIAGQSVGEPQASKRQDEIKS